MGTESAMTGKPQIWRFGQTSSFGILLRILTGRRVLVLLYGGVIADKKVEFLWKDDTGADAGEDSDEEASLKLTFKQTLKTSLLEYTPHAAVVPFSAFPICISATRESEVVYSNASFENCKTFSEIDEAEFYDLKTGEEAGAYSFPDLDEDIYVTKGSSDTKKALLIPLWYVSAELDTGRSVKIKSVLNIVQSENFIFAENDEKESPSNTGSHCQDHTGDSTSDGAGTATGGSAGGGSGAIAGISDPAPSESGLTNCNEDDTED